MNLSCWTTVPRSMFTADRRPWQQVTSLTVLVLNQLFGFCKSYFSVPSVTWFCHIKRTFHFWIIHSLHVWLALQAFLPHQARSLFLPNISSTNVTHSIPPKTLHRTLSSRHLTQYRNMSPSHPQWLTVPKTEPLWALDNFSFEIVFWRLISPQSPTELFSLLSNCLQ